MSYRRTIPRDLFNEANLLKCLGRIYINLETADLPGAELVHDGGAFDVQQDISGELSVSNVVLQIGNETCRFFRPLNSREAWPLCFLDEEGETVLVFDEQGAFSDEFLDHVAARLRDQGLHRTRAAPQ